jgi:hypothetical protein
MIYYFPYVLVLTFAALAMMKGQNLRNKPFLYQLGASLSLMLMFRDVCYFFGIV